MAMDLDGQQQNPSITRTTEAYVGRSLQSTRAYEFGEFDLEGEIKQEIQSVICLFVC